MNTERYLTPLEVEKFAGRKCQTLANERYRGVGIPYYKVGASIRYKFSDMVTFMEQHRIEPQVRPLSTKEPTDISLNQSGSKGRGCHG